MKIVFRTNLGSYDAKRLGLDHMKCGIGKTIDVNAETAAELTKRGVAVSEEDAEKDRLIQSARGVPDSEIDGATSVKAIGKKPEVTAPAKA